MSYKIDQKDVDLAVSILLKKFTRRDDFDKRVLLHSLGVDKNKVKSFSLEELDKKYMDLTSEYINLIKSEGQENVVQNKDHLLVAEILSNKQDDEFNKLKNNYNE